METIIKSEINKLNYKRGDTSLSGAIIETIYCAEPDSIVFMTKSGAVSWEYLSKNGKIADRAATRLNEVRELIPNDLDKHISSKITVSLCNVFFSALNSSSIEACNECFIGIEERVTKLKTPYQIKSIFILYSILFSFLLSTISANLYFFTSLNFKAIFISISCGCVGSLFSVMQRNDKLNLNVLLSTRYIILQASFTALLGCISGGIVYLLSNSGLALSFINDNVYSLAIVSIVGGFSERMIPEVFSKLDKESIKN